MRAAADPAYAALLERMRIGACTDAAVALINTRLLSPANVLDCSSCASNCDRAAINRSSIAAAAAGGATVWRLPCVLTRTRGAAVGLSDAVRNAIHAMPDSKDTSQLVAPTLDCTSAVAYGDAQHRIQVGQANGAVGRQLVTDDKGSQFQATCRSCRTTRRPSRVSRTRSCSTSD
jgi:hypothetical protein